MKPNEIANLNILFASREKLVRRAPYGAPNRCSVELGNGKWYSREWRFGEKARYEHDVLRRKS